MKTLISLILISLLMTGYISYHDKSNPKILEKGTEISGKLVTAIMARLNAEIQKNGVPSAIDYCSVHAIPITDSISRKEQVEISRVSHKPRNPLNAASNRGIEMIERYIVQLNEGNQLVPLVVAENGQITYYSPVVLSSPMCLSCHGEYDSIDLNVRKVLNERYPDDKAVDFELNEIRGMFKIVFDKEMK